MMRLRLAYEDCVLLGPDPRGKKTQRASQRAEVLLCYAM